MAISGAKSCFPLVTFADPNAVIGILQVELGKDNGAMEPIEKLGDQGKRVAVLHCNGVEATVVNAEA